MKKIGLALMSLVLLAACQQKGAKDNAVNEEPKDSMVVSVMDIDTVIVLDADCKATISIPVDGAQYGMAQYKWKRATVYFEPGKDIVVDWDMTPSGLFVAFEGENADKNNFINSKEMQGPVMGDFGLTEEEILEKLIEYQADNYKILDGKGFDEDFVAKEKRRVDYWVYGILWQFSQRKNCSEAVYEKLQSLMQEEEWLLQLSEYTNYMCGTISVLANRGKADTDAYGRTINEMEYVVNNIKNQNIKEFLLGYFAISYVSENGIDNADYLKELVEKNVTDPEILSTFGIVYAEGEVLAAGAKSPDFKMTDINGKEYTLADFKGRVLYIDVWATWCAPCKAELPKLHALAENFKGTNVVFISMSVDKDKAAWEKMVKEEKLGGVQLYAGPESQFIADYKVNGIPRFILIDKEGKIVEANMTRPSEEKTLMTIAMIAEGME